MSGDPSAVATISARTQLIKRRLGTPFDLFFFFISPRGECVPCGAVMDREATTPGTGQAGRAERRRCPSRSRRLPVTHQPLRLLLENGGGTKHLL
jgi:hypothetical protein